MNRYARYMRRLLCYVMRVWAGEVKAREWVTTSQEARGGEDDDDDKNEEEKQSDDEEDDDTDSHDIDTTTAMLTKMQRIKRWLRLENLVQLRHAGEQGQIRGLTGS